MQNKALAYCATLLLAGTAGAQEQPLSVIDWIKRNPDQPAMTSAVLPKRFEPPVTPGALVPEVTVQTLDEKALRIIGLVPSSVTGLPENLWTGSSAQGLKAHLENMPVFRLPAAQALLYTLLLTETTGPGNDSVSEDILTLARVETLIRFGAHEPALSLLRKADVTRDTAHFATYMDLALLTGQEDTACVILDANTHLSPSLAHRTFCAARRGDWPTAALLFDTGNSLGALSKDETAVLERFLYPEAFEYVPPIERPQTMTPLLFRLHEAIGEPLPTGSLPRAYAVADLRDIVGWKAQLEAAERLAVTGALPANRLLGFYTERQAAASGGVWDRVRAVQRFEAALRSRSQDAVQKSLPEAWDQMQQVGLELIFADLFADAVARYDLEGAAGKASQNMRLLSPDYQQTAQDGTIPPFIYAIAQGNAAEFSAKGTRDQAIAAGFDTKNARPDLINMARNGRMGEAIFRALFLLNDGASGDPVALTQALATLRSFGLEDTVRRAALQIVLLERYSG